METFYYVPIREDTKMPALAWGGWPPDPSRDEVVTYNEALESKHEWWAVVGNHTEDLLVIDIDWYKMSESQKRELRNDDFAGTLEDTRIVESPKGGRHIYYRFDGSLDDYTLIEHVDPGGNVGTRYMKSPMCEGYKLRNDKPPLKITDEELEQFPVFEKKVIERPKKSRKLENMAPCLKKARRDENEEVLQLAIDALHGRNHTPDGSVYDVLRPGQYPPGVNKPAPSWMHTSPSETGSNFKVHDDEALFRCWRHGISGNVYHLIGIKEDIITCRDRNNWDDVTRSQWQQIFDVAKRKYSIEKEEKLLTCQTIKDMDACPWNCGRNDPLE